MQTVAVIGASSDRSKFGNKAVRAFALKGFKVLPVHPTEDQVEGLACFSTVSELPDRPDIVTVYVRPAVLLPILPAIAKRGCDELWLNPGTASPEVLESAKQLGLQIVQHCSLLAIGVSPSSL